MEGEELVSYAATSHQEAAERFWPLSHTHTPYVTSPDNMDANDERHPGEIKSSKMEAESILNLNPHPGFDKLTSAGWKSAHFLVQKPQVE